MSKKPTYTKGEDGKMFMELHDPDDEQKRALNPTTGTETDQHWPDVEPEVPPPPLLDLAQVWQDIASSKLIDVPADDENLSTVINEDNLNIDEKNALIMTQELKYYILASNNYKIDDKDENEDDNKKSIKSNDGNKKNDDSETKEEKKELPKSTYGACMLLKYQWEEHKKKQKDVKKKTFTELGDFLVTIYDQLNKLNEVNENAMKQLINSISLELTPILFCRLLDGIETNNQILEESSLSLLKLCSEKSNPKEMHIGLLLFIKKIDPVYFQPTSYLVFDPLLQIWPRLISRIPRKRHSFLLDFVRNFDKMSYSTQGWSGVPTHDDYDKHSKNPQHDYGITKEGRCDNVPRLAFQFYIQLTRIQNAHRSSNQTIKNKIDEMVKSLPSFSLLKNMADDDASREGETENGNGNGHDQPDDADENKNISEEKEDPVTLEARDWVAERSVLLARALKMQTNIWEKLAAPEGEERFVPNRKNMTSSIVKPGPKKTSKRKLTKEQREAEEDLPKVINLIKGLGWKNPVLACQIGNKGLGLDLIKWEHELLGNHIVNDVRKRRELKYTLYSIQSIGQFVCGYLRLYSNRRGIANEEEKINDMKIDFKGSGFEFLQAEYAFDLVLPYIMALIGQGILSAVLYGVVIIQQFLMQLPEDYFNGYDKVLEIRSGNRAMTTDISLYGLAQQLVRAIGIMDNPGQRLFVYNCLKLVLKKIKHPGCRYTISEALLLHDIDRIAVQAQLITEMKDAIRYCDQCLNDEDNSWTIHENNEVKNRFAEMIISKYFIPRKEMVGCVNAMVAASNAFVYVIGSDIYQLENKHVGDENITNRLKYLKTSLKLGKECLRALASAAEHDRKTVPNWKLVKDNVEDAKALYAVSGKTLSQCLASIHALEMGLDRIDSLQLQNRTA